MAMTYSYHWRFYLLMLNNAILITPTLSINLNQARIIWPQIGVTSMIDRLCLHELEFESIQKSAFETWKKNLKRNQNIKDLRMLPDNQKLRTENELKYFLSYNKQRTSRYTQL